MDQHNINSSQQETKWARGEIKLIYNLEVHKREWTQLSVSFLKSK